MCVCTCVKREKKNKNTLSLRELKTIFKSTIFFKKQTNW